MRALEADRGWGSRLVWVVALALAAAWIAWFSAGPAQALFRMVAKPQ